MAEDHETPKAGKLSKAGVGKEKKSPRLSGAKRL